MTELTPRKVDDRGRIKLDGVEPGEHFGQILGPGGTITLIPMEQRWVAKGPPHITIDIEAMKAAIQEHKAQQRLDLYVEGAC